MICQSRSPFKPDPALLFGPLLEDPVDHDAAAPEPVQDPAASAAEPVTTLQGKTHDIQGDQAACSKPPAVTKTKVAFLYMGSTLFFFYVYRKFGTSCLVTLYSNENSLSNDAK